MNKSPWQQKIEKRTQNIGFLTRSGIFREPSEAEKAVALAVETKSWQEPKWKDHWKTSVEYSESKASKENLGTNLKSAQDQIKIQKAIKAYRETPMETIGKFTGVNIQPYKRSSWEKFVDWIAELFPKKLKPRNRPKWHWEE